MNPEDVGTFLKSMEVQDLSGWKGIFRTDIEMLIYHTLSGDSYKKGSSERFEFTQVREHLIVLFHGLCKTETGIENPVLDSIM